MATTKKTDSTGNESTAVKKPRKTRSDKGVKKGVAPVINTSQNEVDSRGVDVQQGSPRDLSAEGDASLDAPVIEVAQDNEATRTKVEEMAFMEENIEIIVHDSADQNAQPIVESWCNGKSQFFVRGQANIVKRKFVGVLARAKKTTFTQQNYRDGKGDLAIRNVPHTALQYPFSVLSDSNPKGVAWLRETLEAAA